MMPPLTTNTKAILLLTAPLNIGRQTPAAELLTAGEYKTFAQRLHDIGGQPADLLGPDAAKIIEESKTAAAPSRLQQLLSRGLQLGQAVDRWKQRSIWVVSRADPEYPRRLKARLRNQAPAILYGCGEISALDSGGLAVVGSRHVDDELVRYAIAVASLAARADRPVVSGGAKGIDQAAMRGALEAGGKVCGVLTDSLERQVMTRENREMLLDGKLVLMSPYDPNAGFHAGHAMQRNKIVYALADAALIVSSDLEKGGTWTGAIEQLRKLKLVTLYVRSTGKPHCGLDALRGNGAISWPNPATPEDLLSLLDAAQEQPKDMQMSWVNEVIAHSISAPDMAAVEQTPIDPGIGAAVVTAGQFERVEPKLALAIDSAKQLFDTARPTIIDFAQRTITDRNLAEKLQIPKPLARLWLEKLVADGVLQKRKRPAGYIISQPTLL